MRDPSEVRRAKEKLKALVQGRPWYRGIGIAPHPDGPTIRLNVAADAVIDEALPLEFEGVPVETVRIDAYEPRK